jgi:hypothetical protein
MSKSNTLDWMTGERFLGKEVGKIENFLAITSCMNPNERLMYAQVEIFVKLLKFSKEKEIDIEKFIQNVLKPSIQMLGWANWNRDVLTDLSLKTATATNPRQSLKELDK